jgi:two-component system, OmpR family, sensor histidine kinase VicK
LTIDAIGEWTEVLHGKQNVLRSELEFFSNSKEKIDTCMNYTRPTLAITIEPIRAAFVDAKKRGIKLRYLTEVTKDNISYCRELIPLVDEIRHLDGIKGNFMVSELEYLAPIVLFEKGKIASKIIYSNEKELVDQHQYMFDTLWTKATSAKQKIKEIEEGIVEQHYQTRLLEKPHEVSEEIRKTINRHDDDEDWSICSTFDGLLMMTSNKDFEMQERLVDNNKRGKSTRWVGTINKDNIHLIKAYLDLGMKIKHIKNMPPMNFAVSSKELYITIDEMKGGKIAKNVLVSNEPAYIRHYFSIFEDLWKDGVNAEDKIREIEEGLDPIGTRILENQDEIVKQIRNLNNRADHLSICSSLGGMQMSYNFFLDTYRSMVDKFSKREEKKEGSNKLGWIINVDRDSIKLVKSFLDLGFQIRHVKNMLPINFGVSDKEVALTIEKMEGGKMSRSFLISNEPLYVNHFNSLFGELWKDGIDATERIKDIEAGVDLADVEVISSSTIAQDRYLDIVKSASEEILWIFPTSNAFLRQDKMSAIPLAVQAARERNVKVKILVPANKVVEQRVQQLKQNCQSCQIDVRYIEQMSETKATILVVDRKHSLIMELKDDSKTTFHGAIGLSTYSNSKAGVLSYVSIFENLWKQSELYEQLKIHDIMQKEFIDIAAHELRTPIQPIISLSEVVLSNTKDMQQAKLLEVINRNANRLHRLTEDILDVTKIESQSLNLKKEQFNLNDVITSAIDDILANKVFYKAKNASNDNAIKFLYSSQDIFVYADKARIGQVIHNLLDNAVKFINYKEEGTITVNVEKKAKQQLNNNDQQQIIVSIKDTGNGIDSEIMPRLFTKFATKSETGTGLGLFICKGIIGAHGGRIWAENNADGKGATFSFSLPIVNNKY